MRRVAVTLIFLFVAVSVFAQQPRQGGDRGIPGITSARVNPQQNAGNNQRPNCCDYTERPKLVFREGWKEIPTATPITQDHISDPNLTMTLWGAGKQGIRKSHHTFPGDDPDYVWGGPATGKWALSLRHKDSYLNMTTVSKVRWRTMQTGIRTLHIILKLADGSWIISDEGTGASKDWTESELNFPNLHWRMYEPNLVIEGDVVEQPDLTRVDEIGFTDLMFGGYAYSSSRVDWMEVYAYPVPRTPTTASGK